MKVTEPHKLPAASAPWARQVSNGVNEIDIRLSNFLSDQTNKNRTVAANAQGLSSQFQAIPTVVNHGVSATALSLNSTYRTVVEDTITIPTTRRTCNLFSIANAQFLDSTTGGAAMCYGRMLVRPLDGDGAPITGYSSFEYIAAKAYGASVTPNSFSVAYADSIVMPDTAVSLYIAFQAYCTNASAVPANAQNFAQLSTNASFVIVNN